MLEFFFFFWRVRKFSLNVVCKDGWNRTTQPAGIQTPVEQDQAVAGRGCCILLCFFLQLATPSCPHSFFREFLSTTMPTSQGASTVTR